MTENQARQSVLHVIHAIMGVLSINACFHMVPFVNTHSHDLLSINTPKMVQNVINIAYGAESKPATVSGKNPEVLDK